MSDCTYIHPPVNMKAANYAVRLFFGLGAYFLTVVNLWPRSPSGQRNSHSHSPVTLHPSPFTLHPSPFTSNSSSSTNSAKPYFIIHVGPPKTATTYLQAELTSWEDFLRDEDNLTFAGKHIRVGQEEVLGPIVSALRDINCQTQALRRLQQEEEEDDAQRRQTSWTTKNSSSIPKCWAQFLLSLEEYRRNGQSIIVSDEVFSFPHKFHIQWDLIHRDFSVGWNLVVIVAYRRWADWLPSVKQQVNRWTPSKPKLNAWPGTGRGKEFEPTMDWIRAMQQGGSAAYRHTLHMVDAISTGDDEYRIDTRVLDIHYSGSSSNIQGSVRSNLFCQILSDITPNACDASRLRDLTERQSRVNPKQTEFYDKLGTAAAAAGLLLGNDYSRFNRHTVALAIQHHQESVLNRTSFDFVLDCPTRNELEALLNTSLTIEMDLAHRGLIRTQPDDHEESFWSHTSQYCWINTTAVLAMKEWKAFFQHLVNENAS